MDLPSILPVQRRFRLALCADDFTSFQLLLPLLLDAVPVQPGDLVVNAVAEIRSWNFSQEKY